MTPEGARPRVDAATLLDVRVLAVLVPTSIVTSVLTRGPDGAQATLAWIAVNVASLVVTGIWVGALLLVLADGRYRLGVRPRVGPVLAVLIGASVGLAKGTTTSLFGWSAGLIDDPVATGERFRAVSATLQGAVALPALALVVAALGRFRAEYDRLVLERARARLEAAPSPLAGHDARIARFVAEARDRIDAAADPTVVTVLDELVEQRLRPLTRDLWVGDGVATDFTARSLGRAALHADRLPVLPVALALGVVDLLFRGGAVAPALSVAISGSKALALAGVFTLAARLRPRDRRFETVQLLVTLSVTAAVIVLIEFATVRPPASDLSLPAGFVLTLVTLTGFTLLTSAARVALRTRNAVRGELERILDAQVDEAVDTVSRRMRDREVADRLHSGVQNRLIAAARRIDVAGGDADVVRAEVAAVGRVLDTLVDELDAPEDDAEVRLAGLVERWAGFVAVTVDVAAVLPGLAGPLQDGLARAATEAVNNAVRHGRAERVDVRARRVAGGLELEVVDDGLGPVKRPPGLGSSLFDALSGGDWTLQGRPEGGSRLLLRFPAG